MTLKILLTGGCGFIGSNLVHLALEKEYEIVNIDKLTYAGNLLSLDDISGHPGYSFVQGDISDVPLVSRIFEKHQPDAVIHLAAESHVDRSIDSPEPFMQTNILGTFHLLEAARRYWKTLPPDRQKSFRFLHVSTDEVFGSLGKDGYFTEETPYGPRSPYSASKASSDHVVRSYFHTFGFPALVTNCSNNYGPRQFPEKLIPHIFLNALKGNPLPVYGDGSNVRDWIFVLDHCLALLCVLEKGIPGETYAIGADSEKSNLCIVKAICGILDRKCPRQNGKSYEDLISFVPDRPGHDKRYALDARKIRHELGWKPEVAFEAGLEMTIEWYLAHREWTESILNGSYTIERLGLKGDVRQ